MIKFRPSMRASCAAALVLASGAAANATSLTGNPAADGWSHVGHSLHDGTYVRGSANYGFNMYTTMFTVKDSSAFSLAGHDGAAYDAYYIDTDWDTTAAREWSVGHQVVGVGGSFEDVAAAAAGWAAFSGNGVNSQLDDNMRVQAKIGTAAATWSDSTIAPGSGNGSGSTSDGGAGTIFVRSSSYLGGSFATYSGEMMGLQNVSHLTRSGTVSPGTDAARLIWHYESGALVSWEILVNLSLVAADEPGGFAGLMPELGDMVIWSVQRGNGAYTDALANIETDDVIIPLPTPALLSIAGLTGVMAVRRRRGL